MSTVDIDRLRRLLGGEETRWLLQRIRGRLERGRGLVGAISLPQATTAQRRAVDTILGRPPRPGQSLTVPLAHLDAVIRRSGLHSDGLEAAVVALTGPVVVRADADAELADAWESALTPLKAIVARRPALAPWFELATARGLVKRLSGTPNRAAPVIASAARLLDLLPLTGTPLGQVAHDVAGDAHALDHGRPLASLVLSAIRHTWWPASETVNSPAQRRRALWDCVGIATDELSTTALALNLPTCESSSELTRILHIARECGEPLVLTLRQLTRHQSNFRPVPVFVCENPAVVLAAANTIGPSCPPLVCVSGQPTAAVLLLLSLLADAGCSLHYHGDFDWGGIRIANLLWSRYPMQAWRFNTQSYLEQAHRQSGALRGKAADAAWDPELSSAIALHGVRVEEEAVLADLLADLEESADAAAASPDIGAAKPGRTSPRPTWPSTQ
jgi:uncharacterized protein (TIGR02679 family)